MPFTKFLSPAGRALLALVFLYGAYTKIADPAGTQAYIASVGLPLPLLGLILAILVEVAGGVLLLIGYQTRIAGMALAVFTIVVTVFFHTNVVDPSQILHFIKNLGIIGGLLQLSAYGAGSPSVDARRDRIS